MLKQKEVEVRDQPPRAVEPGVIERTVYVEDRQPRFLLGLILGALLLAGGVALFADQEGSSRPGGIAADQAAVEAKEQARETLGSVQPNMNNAAASANP